MMGPPIKRGDQALGQFVVQGLVTKSQDLKNYEQNV